MLTAIEIDRVLAELAPRVVGGQIQKVRQPDDGTLVLRIRSPGVTTRLVVSIEPSRVAEAPGSVPTRREPTALGAWLRSAGGGRRLEAIERVPGDRVVVLTMAGGRLVAELTGRHANLFAVDPEGRVVALARPDGSRRGLTTGGPYVAPDPPPPGRVDPPPRFESALAVEAAAAARQAAAQERAEATARRRLIQRARKRLERLHDRVSADVERAARAEQWRRRGELLKGALGQIERGMQAVEVVDWFAEGTPTVSVPLDPALDGPENLQRCFDRYKKAAAGAERAGERLEEVEAQQFTVELLAEAMEGETPPSADEIEQQLIGAGILPRPQGPPGRRQVVERLPYRAFESRRGERILVGRGGADNHATTFGVARGNDHWLHTRDVPGAHVIVPLPARGREPHLETLRDAAALAVHHSDLRDEPGVEVMHTRRKHVRAIKGAGPGRVTVAAAKSIVVDDGPERIRRLYAARR